MQCPPALEAHAASQWVLFASVPVGFGKQTAFVVSHAYFTAGGGGGGGVGWGGGGVVQHVWHGPVQNAQHPLEVTPVALGYADGQ